MRLVIDMQGAQTESRFRGIGRYSIALTKAIVQNSGEHEIILAVSGLFPETIETIRSTFNGLLSQDNIRIWYAPGTIRECDAGDKWHREIAELIREAFLQSLNPDIVLLTSLFEGYVDDAVTSIGRLNQNIPVSMILYDLIPLINQNQYLKINPTFELFYQRKIGHLQRASLLLSISEYTKDEGTKYFKKKDNDITNISTAMDATFCPALLTSIQKKRLLKKYNIKQPFVMYTGGNDERKNLPRLVRAYSQLPLKLRQTHQLVFIGKIEEAYIYKLKKEAKKVGLKQEEYCFTGYVDDSDLVQLYNLCKLFIFPSWYEGFGLPVLEAMCCGAVVIGANTTSIPEVIGLDEALFDPYSEKAIAKKMTQALSDNDLRKKIQQHAKLQIKKFSWDQSAQKAIAAMEQVVLERKTSRSTNNELSSRPKLAYLSPIPPERSGIADYSAELLPELSRYYDIEVINNQDICSDPYIKANFAIRSLAWFKHHAEQFDRILYQFGNSPFHEHMFDLINDFPGVIILHDFFLSSIQAYRENSGLTPNAWVESLYHSHGYNAVKERYHTKNITDIILKYPCNFEVLRHTHGIISHSQYSKQLSQHWYGKNFFEHWEIVPLLRKQSIIIKKSIARHTLGLQDDDFIVCSFGMIDSTKLNHRLLKAWIDSSLAMEQNCKLIFVGQNHGGEYGQRLLEDIIKNGNQDHICITGWVDTETYIQYLSTADMAVQLRTDSRGETSAAVLDCMNYSLPTIINAHGSMNEISCSAVMQITDEFENHELTDALESLWKDSKLRHKMGKRAQKIIQNQHSPDTCGALYREAIESFYQQGQGNTSSLVTAIAKLDCEHICDTDLIAIAQTISLSVPTVKAKPQLLVDISPTCHSTLKTGIERVARALLLELIKSSPKDYRIEPVYLSDIGGHWHYRYARTYTLNLLECPIGSFTDEAVEITNGDIVIGLDLFGQGLVDAKTYLDRLYDRGVKIYFLLHDLLPILMPDFFPPGTDSAFFNWLQVITRYDGTICVSRSVADDLREWIERYGPERKRPYVINWSHHGADLESSAPTSGLPDDAKIVLKLLQDQNSFLMVGTIEPRKGYRLVLDAFSLLWQQGVNINLVIVGREGWKDLPDSMRRTIPEVLEQIHSHPELNKHLFWFEDCSDEFLEKIYAVSSCLIAASEGEGFGLPLIEAAQHKLSIIARDIPVFREVAGAQAHFFNSNKSDLLAAVIKEWLVLYENNEHIISNNMPWLIWEQSAQKLLKIIID